MTTTISAPSLLWRRILLAIAALILLTLLAGCGEQACSHDWSEPTCTAPATCSRCGETEGVPAPHTYPGSICTGTVKCTVCETVVLAAGHDWLEADCLVPKVCRRCNTAEGEALGHKVTDGVCERCSEIMWKALHASGIGSGTVTDVILGSDFYAMHASHDGTGAFQVEVEDAAGGKALLVNTQGDYEGTVLLYGASPVTFNITANGSWTYTIDKVEAGDTAELSGSGDSVTQAVPAGSGTYHITHNGSGNFYVYAFSPGVMTPVVQPMRGNYDKKQELTLPDDGLTLFEIHASGDWTISAMH